MLVNVIAVIDAMKGHVGKTPLTRIEVIALVNASYMVIAVIDAPYKNRLASVAIASPFVKDKDSGKIPDVVFRAHVKPALPKAGISAPVGWHTLRHSFGTLMKANGEDLKTIQELLRHATFKVTADTYTQAVTPVKREAQAKVAKLILADIPAAKPATTTIQ